MRIVRAEDLQPGDRIDDKYEVRAVLGRGGMGVVVEALHLDLQERVALKFLLAEARDHEDTTARFLREARTVRKLKSKHIVEVIDVGRRADSGEPYIAMELLVGRDLSAELAECGPLPVATACTFALQACDALAEAHANRIIHRDIKPANLFLTYPRGGGPCIKVLDFGIAKVVEGDGKGTHTQAMMGSALYMSPEQMRSSKTVDARTDVWALGVTLYELLTGHTPFSADSIPELILAITSDPPVPAHKHRPDLPPALEAVLASCFEKDVAARIPTMAALAAALAPFADPDAASLARVIAARGIALDVTVSQPVPREEAATPVVNVPSLQASTGLDLTVTHGDRPRPDRSRVLALSALVLFAMLAAFLLRARRTDDRAAEGTETFAAPAPASARPGGLVVSAAPPASATIAAPSIEIAPIGVASGEKPSVAPTTAPTSAAGRAHSAPTTAAAKPAAKDVRATATPAGAAPPSAKNAHLGTSVD